MSKAEQNALVMVMGFGLAVAGIVYGIMIHGESQYKRYLTIGCVKNEKEVQINMLKTCADHGGSYSIWSFDKTVCLINDKTIGDDYDVQYRCKDD